MTKISNNQIKIKENRNKTIWFYMEQNYEPKQHPHYSNERCESEDNYKDHRIYPSLLSIQIVGIYKQVTVWCSKTNSKFIEFLINLDIEKDFPELNSIMNGDI